MNSTCVAASYLPTLMTYMTSLITEQTSAPTPIDLPDGGIFDFIVVGAGSAGCVVANRLSEISNWSVLLLEAGGEEPFTADVPSFLTYAIGSSMDWGIKTVPQNTSCGGKSCYWPRGNDGWSYEDVLPYFKKSENNLDADIAKNTRYHGVGGYLNVGRFPQHDENAKAIHEAFREIGYGGIDFNTQTHRGVMAAQGTIRNGERQSSNRAFLDPIRSKRSNLKVATGVMVKKVLIHPENNTAYGVEYALEKDRRKTGKLFARKEIILSAGAVNSPHLLLLSGVGPKATLNSLNIPVIKDLNVGQNLQDHFSAPGVFFTLDEKASKLPTNEDILLDSLKYSAPQRSGPWSSIGVSSTCAKVNTRFADRSIDNPDVQLIFTTKNTCADSAMPICYYNAINFHSTLLRPKSRGYLTINNTDPFTQPLIYPNYFTHPDDVDAILDSFNVVIHLGNTQALKDAGFTLNTTFLPTKEDFETGKNPMWENDGWFSFHHQSGTCKMGPKSDKSAVVDPQLKVHGVEGLRVADASIMPQVTSGNINAPCMMIGEKASDLIKNSWGR
ncbi:Glucose dehydrogenase [FAD, quinone] [Blattella germanica]|nr:Glucose dehydrogenase [FAD, quinone] [Blattella germanica]